ncbi:hypothetical protein PRZ48_009767 [Zasmidium cellare]|uniref:Uncharacterized protein n=1 Tax=Zasmidium cellare TaxID=395010 RepID=A0ABR0ECM0_ZASCE|nr:hypothetical protein PRZ48_009767 [Zasmidium cellare]
MALSTYCTDSSGGTRKLRLLNGVVQPANPEEEESRLQEARTKFLSLKAAQGKSHAEDRSSPPPDRDASPGLEQFLRKRSEERQLARAARPAPSSQEPSAASSRRDASPDRDGDATQEPDEMTPATNSPLPQQVEQCSPSVFGRHETSGETAAKAEDDDEEIAVAAGRLVAAVEEAI